MAVLASYSLCLLFLYNSVYAYWNTVSHKYMTRKCQVILTDKIYIICRLVFGPGRRLFHEFVQDLAKLNRFIVKYSNLRYVLYHHSSNAQQSKGSCFVLGAPAFVVFIQATVYTHSVCRRLLKKESNEMGPLISHDVYETIMEEKHTSGPVLHAAFVQLV